MKEKGDGWGPNSLPWWQMLVANVSIWSQRRNERATYWAPKRRSR